MIRLLGHTSAACDRMTRRDLLRAGSLALLGSGLASGAAPSVASTTTKKRIAKSVILIDLFGGPSHIDTFDPKPDAPAEIRGEFQTIPTVLAGIRVTEHLPKLARYLNRTSLIRTVSHGYNSHNPYAVMTGFTGGQDQTNYFARPTDHPSIPSVCRYFGLGRGKELPGYMMLPAFPGYSQGLRRAGPYGGYLGPKYDPFFSTCNPKWDSADGKAAFYDGKMMPRGEPLLPKFDGSLTLDALQKRQSLVKQLDLAAGLADSLIGSETFAGNRASAFQLLTSDKARRAFDLNLETPATRERYGNDLFGQSVLMARRLVEAGVTFVTVHTEAAQGNGHWDTHSNNFGMLKGVLLPFLDRSVSALIEDMNTRGMMDETLVLIHGDMGRSPKVSKTAGRDHWPKCGFCLLFGAGIRQGIVHGLSDKSAAYPVEHPVSPGDLAATVYELVGIDPEATVPDQGNRPIAISHGGRPVRAVMK